MKKLVAKEKKPKEREKIIEKEKDLEVKEAKLIDEPLIKDVSIVNDVLQSPDESIISNKLEIEEEKSKVNELKSHESMEVKREEAVDLRLNESVSDQISMDDNEVEDQLESSSTTISLKKVSQRQNSHDDDDVLSSHATNSPSTSPTRTALNESKRSSRYDSPFKKSEEAQLAPRTKTRIVRMDDNLEEEERYSPSSLERLLYAGLNYLDVLGNSAAQLEELDKVRCIGLAQQETVTLAHLLKNQQFEIIIHNN